MTFTAVQDHSLNAMAYIELPPPGPVLIADLIPDDPLMMRAWIDCFHWATTFDPILSAYAKADGRQDVRAFAEWFHANVWGEIGMEDIRVDVGKSRSSREAEPYRPATEVVLEAMERFDDPTSARGIAAHVPHGYCYTLKILRRLAADGLIEEIQVGSRLLFRRLRKES